MGVIGIGMDFEPSCCLVGLGELRLPGNMALGFFFG